MKILGVYYGKLNIKNKYDINKQWRWDSFKKAPKKLQDKVWKLAEEQYDKQWLKANQKAHRIYERGLR